MKTDRKFEPHCVSYQEGDLIYLGSDGFQDQIGGPKDEKYKSKKLHEFLIKNSQLPLEVQEKKLRKEFFDWKKKSSQIDDVCIVGVKL